MFLVDSNSYGLKYFINLLAKVPKHTKNVSYFWKNSDLVPTLPPPSPLLLPTLQKLYQFHSSLIVKLCFSSLLILLRLWHIKDENENLFKYENCFHFDDYHHIQTILKRNRYCLNKWTTKWVNRNCISMLKAICAWWT